MPNPTCMIEGCAKPARTKAATLCAMHYHRQYRNGSPGEAAARKRKQRNPHCQVEGCSKPDKEAGLCSMHGARKRRHGDPAIVIAPHERDMPTGEAHHNWVGSDVRYGAAHDRVKRRRGSASSHDCVECGQPAYHWSYDHADPDEKYAHNLSARPIAYSDKPEHYQARCVPCHKRFDLDRVDALKV